MKSVYLAYAAALQTIDKHHIDKVITAFIVVLLFYAYCGTDCPAFIWREVKRVPAPTPWNLGVVVIPYIVVWVLYRLVIWVVLKALEMLARIEEI